VSGRAAGARAAPLRVLLVEDSADYAHLVVLALDAVVVRHAASLAAARDLLAAEPFDVVLLDLHLPDAEGEELTGEVVGAAGPVPVVGLSGSTDPALVAGAMRAGAAGFIPKGGEVDGTLEQMLRATAARRPRPRAAAPRPLTGAAAASGLIAAVMGLLLLMGWAAGLELRGGDDGSAAIVPGVASALIAAGLAAFGLGRGRHPALWRSVAGASAVLGLAVLAGVALGLGPGADGAGPPWRGAPPGVVALVVTAAGLALTGRWGRAHLLAVPPALIVFAGVLGALYGYGADAGIGESIGTALVTLGLGALTFALLLLHPERGIGSVLSSPTDAGRLGRRLVPVALVVPSALGALRLVAFEAGLVEEDTSLTLLGSSLIVVAVLVIVLAARTSIRLEVGRASAEEALDLSEDRFRSLAALAPVGILELDPAAGATFVNARFSELSGLAPERARGDGWREAVHPDDRARLDAAWDRLVASGGSAAIEVRFRRPDGTATWTQLSAVSMRPSADGAPAGVLGVVTDIEPFKAAAALLERERSMLRAMVDHAPVAIELRDADGLVQLVNEQAAAALGRPEAAILGRHPSELLPADRCAEREAREAPVVLDGRVVAYEEAIPAADGGIQHRHVTTYPVRGADGSVLGIGSMALDVTERVEAAAALRAAEERFRGAFAAAPNPVAVTDGLGRIEQANPALAALLGRPGDALAGVDLTAVLDPIGGVSLERSLAQLGQGRSAGLVAEAVVRRAGGPRRVTAQAVTLHDDAGRAAGLLWHLQDITERHELERRLRHLADHDPLTGLLNRRRFADILDQHALRARRHGVRGALLLVDLDGFEAVNDARGHLAGDAVLRIVADLLRSRLGDTDVVARLGGDEFAILLPEASAQEGRHVADALEVAVRDETARRGIPLTATVGVAPCGATGDAQDAIDRADRAMYAARRKARLRVA
jgi:diguanylate cyclase (GGDEF)-like protein/PAS domain S-box-containing protein